MHNWFFWTILSMVTFGVWGFFSKLAVNFISPQSAVIYQVAGGLVIGIASLGLLNFRPETHPMGILFAILTGITGVLGTLFYYMAATRGQIAIIAGVTGLYPLVTILLAMVFLHETLVLKQVLGLCCAVAAIILLAG